MIVVLEGADCTGKTTLGKCLCDALEKSTYLHNGPNDNSFLHYMDQISKHSGVSEGMTVIDRMWLSELIYGSIVRGKVTKDIEKVIRFFHSRPIITIMCVREDLTRHLDHFHGMDREEYARNHIGEIVNAYHHAWYGCPKQMSHPLLDQLVTFGPLSMKRGYYQYDMDKNTPEEFTNWVLRL